ncbi:uncharacterized protein LOC132548685 [Ylistrum balloti]|uniref:uncharacterized protein LOC132548685 n=1 Tax=Ylistrum balloti TaxID=509963 RepID=UPI002905BBF9|nr:uncharacterized protein LOC132548685 [Ylistrum balloti]
MAGNPDVQFFHRLKKHGVDDGLATVILSSKKFTSKELEDWAILGLTSLKPHDAISIIKNLHFSQNTANRKSAILCSHINNFQKSLKDKEEASTHHQNSKGKGQPKQHRVQSGRGPGRSQGKSEERKQQPIQTDTKYLKDNLQYLKGLSENAKGIPGFSSPGQSVHNKDDKGKAMIPDSGKKHQGKGSKQGGDKRAAKGGDSVEDSDSSIKMEINRKGSAPADKSSLRRRFGSTDVLNKTSGNGNVYSQGSTYSTNQSGMEGLNRKFGSIGSLNVGASLNTFNLDSHCNQGRNDYPRQGRGGGHQNNRPEVVDAHVDDNNQRRRSQDGNRGQDHGRGRGNYRGRVRNRRRRGSTHQGIEVIDQEDEESDSDDSSDTSSLSVSEAGSQDPQRQRLNDFDDTKKKRRRKRKPRSNSKKEEVETFEDEGVDENKIFSYLVKSCGGFIAFGDFVKECDLIPAELDKNKWFRCHKRRFKLFEKEGEILYVSAFYRDVTLCLGYNGLFGRSKICSKTDCEHFHICKSYISGHCSFGETCRYSHNFRDASIVEHKKKLGLLEFSDKEMMIILGNRYPRICSEFLKTTTCSVGENCPKLHMCSLSLKGRCTNETDCPLGHSFDTDHNRWVLQSLEYITWLNTQSRLLLKKAVLVDQSVEASIGTEIVTQKEEPDDEDLERIEVEMKAISKKPYKKGISRENRFKTEKPDDVISFNLNQETLMESSVDVTEKSEPVNESSNKKPKKKSKQNKENVKVTWLDDDAVNIPLCVKHVVGNCSELCPKSHHHHPDQAPYVWQIKHDEIWHSFRPEYSAEIEEGFCNHLDVIDAEIFIENEAVYTVHVCVMDTSNHKGVVYEQDGIMLSDPVRLPVRRLSTQSYVEVKDKKQTASPSFITPWRWFWRDDSEAWQPFDTDNFEKTLERKYKFGQSTYLFTRENYKFKYRIDFRTFRQVNLDTMKKRDLHRRPLFVSRVDIQTKNFPNNLEITDPISKPSHFVPWDLSSDFELVELERVEPEFKTLRDKFFETMDNSKHEIQYIYRVQNWHLYQAYDMKKKNMKKEINLEGQSHDVNEKALFHGTDSMKTCQGICTNNFDFRTSGKNATMYGEGSYFAETSKYSHSYTQPGKSSERYMFQAKVLVGLYARGDRTYRRPPPRPGQTHKLYDSCVDNEAKPSMYIIFERSQSYPEYLIAYREKNAPYLATRPATAQASTAVNISVPVQQRSQKTVSQHYPVSMVTPRATTQASSVSSATPGATTHVSSASRATQGATAPVSPVSRATQGATTHVSSASRATQGATEPVSPVSRATQGATATHQQIIYPSETSMIDSTSHQSHPLSYPIGSGYHDNEPVSSVYDKRMTEGQFNQYLLEDQLERQRQTRAFVRQSEMTPQQKKKDEGCVLQ